MSRGIFVDGHENGLWNMGQEDSTTTTYPSSNEQESPDDIQGESRRVQGVSHSETVAISCVKQWLYSGINDSVGRLNIFLKDRDQRFFFTFSVSTGIRLVKMIKKTTNVYRQIF